MIMSATDVATREREAEKEVFISYFSDLASVVEDNFLDIANKCLSSRLINDKIYGDVSSPATPKEKASKLLTAVKNCMRHQQNVLDKFLGILETESIYGRLIADIKQSYQEVLNRKVVDECTDASPSSKEHATSTSKKQPVDPPTSLTVDNARERVIKRYLPKLECRVQGVTAAIVAEQCQAKGLISSEIYGKVKKFQKKKRAKFLLSNVCHCISADDKKFDEFMGILARRESCKDLARSIQRDVKRESGRSEVVLIHDLGNTVTTAPTSQLRRRREVAEMSTVETDVAIAVSENGCSEGNSKVLVASRVVSTDKIRPKGIDPRTEQVYHLKMAELQSEAQLRKAEKENAQLKDEIRARDLKIEQLKVEKENLQHTLECVQAKVSFLEKKLYESEEKLRDKITKHEKQIETLQKENDGLKKKSNSLEAALKESHDSLEKLLKANQKKLDESIEELKTTTPTTTPDKSGPKALTIFFVVVGIAVLAIGSLIVVWLYRHW